jgi:hypothetical protein
MVSAVELPGSAARREIVNACTAELQCAEFADWTKRRVLWWFCNNTPAFTRLENLERARRIRQQRGAIDKKLTKAMRDAAAGLRCDLATAIPECELEPDLNPDGEDEGEGPGEPPAEGARAEHETLAEMQRQIDRLQEAVAARDAELLAVRRELEETQGLLDQVLSAHGVEQAQRRLLPESERKALDRFFLEWEALHRQPRDGRLRYTDAMYDLAFLLEKQSGAGYDILLQVRQRPSRECVADAFPGSHRCGQSWMY